MEVIVLTKEELDKLVEDAILKAGISIRKELQNLLNGSSIAGTPKQQEEWIDAEEAKRLLNVRKSKLQSLRDNGEILFSQHGRTILYSRKSIYDFLARHSKKTF